jgi:hypothetical protein
MSVENTSVYERVTEKVKNQALFMLLQTTLGENSNTMYL